MVDILQNALLQLLTIVEDEFARQNDEAFGRVALEIFITVMEQLHEFAGIRCGGLVGELARGVKNDARLGGVGDHETHFGLFGELQIIIKILVRVNATADYVDEFHGVNGIAVAVETLDIDVIEAVLVGEVFDFAARPRLHSHDRAVEIGLLVGLLDNPFHKSAEKIALAYLNHLFGVGVFGYSIFVECFHNVVSMINILQS